MSLVEAPPQLDILLPTHERPHTLAFSVASVLAQTHAAFTLHVVGDGCPPETGAVLARIGDPRIRFHGFPKAYGFGYASRNLVLRATSAPYVAYMTDDDLWFPDHLERGLRELAAREADLVAFRSGHVSPPDRLDPHFFAYDWQRGPLASAIRNWFIGSVGCLHRRAVFDRVGYWDERLFRFGDREFYNRVRVANGRTAYVDEITVLRFYAQHWDRLYRPEREPPQSRYLRLVADAEWRRAYREAARPGPRGAAVRSRQLLDFLAFARRSGPRFVRFWWQKLVLDRLG